MINQRSAATVLLFRANKGSFVFFPLEFRQSAVGIPARPPFTPRYFLQVAFRHRIPSGKLSSVYSHVVLKYFSEYPTTYSRSEFTSITSYANTNTHHFPSHDVYLYTQQKHNKNRRNSGQSETFFDLSSSSQLSEVADATASCFSR